MDAFTVMMAVLALIGCGGALVTWISNRRRNKRNKAH